MAREYDLLQVLMVSASKLGARLFRNNTAVAWVGKAYHKPGPVVMGPGDVLLRQARPLHAGLHKGSADLIGWTPVEITPDHLGKHLAVFTSVEAKTQGVPVENDQKAWISAVKNAGGIAGVVYDEEDLRDLLP